MYTVLMVWMANNFQQYIHVDSAVRNLLLLLVSIGSTILLAILYAFIVINYRKKEIATLKCIGYTNNDIRTIIITELVWVSFLAFFIQAEVLIHTTAIMTYIATNSNITATVYVANTTPILNALPVLFAFLIFIVSQVLGILIMYRKILKLRPIVALRVIK
jgi:ABC-type antimicrobial peptide transport system permease subunit